MSEQVQTEEQGGSVVMPLAIGAGAAYLTKRGYDGAANKLASAAFNPGGLAADAKAAPEALVTAAQNVTNAGELQHQLIGARVLQNPDIAKDISGIKISTADKLHTVSVTQANGDVATLTKIEKLPSAAAKIMGDKASHSFTADELKAAKDSGWVSKLGAKTEDVVLKTVRSDKAYKEAGAGIKATLSHAGGGKAALLAAGTAAAAVGLGVGVKNMLGGGSHTDRVEADRAVTTEKTR